MHQTLIQQYENSCLMLMDSQSDGYHYCGTAFVVHSRGYLLTAAHLLDSVKQPVVIAPSQPGVFTHLSMDEGAGVYPVSIARVDEERDIALLKIEVELVIGAPDDFIGNPETLGEGTYLVSIGVSFGHFRIHNIMAMQSMLSAKIISPNDTRLLIFDQPVHPGDVGGPLLNVEKGRIVGIIQGIFNPLQIQQLDQPDNYPLQSSYSYAVSIEYARPLLKAEGLV